MKVILKDLHKNVLYGVIQSGIEGAFQGSVDAHMYLYELCDILGIDSDILNQDPSDLIGSSEEKEYDIPDNLIYFCKSCINKARGIQASSDFSRAIAEVSIKLGYKPHLDKTENE